MSRRFPQVSAMSDVIDAMVDRFGQALDDVTVTDGIYLGGDEVDRLLQVGVDDPETVDGTTNSATSTITWAGLGNLRHDELLTVRLVASAKSGNQEGAARSARVAAFEVMEACQLELTRDPSIAGAIYSLVTEVALRQEQNSYGALAHLMFAVQCRVLVESGQQSTSTFRRPDRP